MTTVAYSRSRALSSVPRPLQPIVRKTIVRARHVGLRPADVLLAGHPKSGTTFLRVVLAGALLREEMDFDKLRDVSREIGQHRGMPAIAPDGGRLLKSHELPVFTPMTQPPKVIYLLRDGRDVAVSYFHNFQRRGFATGDLDTFVADFARGRIGPYGPWVDHVETWTRFVENSSQPATIVRYEDLLSEPVEVFMSVSDTLHLGLDRAVVENAVAHNDVESMRKKEASSKFLEERGATSGSFVRAARAEAWRGELTGAALRDFERVSGSALRAHGYALDDDA